MESERGADSTAPRARPSEQKSGKEHREARGLRVDDEVDRRKQDRLKDPCAGGELHAEDANSKLLEVTQSRLQVATKECFLGQGDHDELRQNEARSIGRERERETSGRLSPEVEADRVEREHDGCNPKRDSQLHGCGWERVANRATQIEKPERTGCSVVRRGFEQPPKRNAEV